MNASQRSYVTIFCYGSPRKTSDIITTDAIYRNALAYGLPLTVFQVNSTLEIGIDGITSHTPG